MSDTPPPLPPERRYNEAEVAAIFERAASAQQGGSPQLPSGDGMTLRDLQQIGREVGIAPELIADAARAVGRRTGVATSRQFLGLPIGVGRTIELDRELTDREWEQLVVDLRETFDARGSLRHDGGSLRQWTNGNLQALLEPTPSGHRVRLRTVKGDARALLTGGLVLLGAAFVGAITANPTGMSLWALIGTAMLGIAAFRLPGWARERRRQMDEIAERLAITTSQAPRES
jgi:hypothetical protein